MAVHQQLAAFIETNCLPGGELLTQLHAELVGLPPPADRTDLFPLWALVQHRVAAGRLPLQRDPTGSPADRGRGL
jgi:hypothetical protein